MKYSTAFAMLLPSVSIQHRPSGDGDDKRYEAHGRKSRPYHVRILPAVTQLCPVHWIGLALRAALARRGKREKTRANAAEFFALQPEFIHRMRKEPVYCLHTDKSEEGYEYQPEVGASQGREDQEDDRGDGAKRLTHTCDSEPGIIDGLHSAVHLLRKAQ